MKDSKSLRRNLIKLSKMLVAAGVSMGLICSIIFTYFHIKILPISVYFYKESVLFVCMLLLCFLVNLFEMKNFKKLVSVGVILNIINLFGFRAINSIIK
jgi:hypothetical protein